MKDLFVTQLDGSLLDIGRRWTTGALRITVQGHLRIAFFEQGALVYFISNLPDESLGAALTRPGRLETPASRSTLAELEQQVTRKRTLVSLLLENGACSAEKLRPWPDPKVIAC